MPREVAEEPRESGSSGPRRAFWRRGLSESTFDVVTFCVTFRFILHFSVKCRDSQSKIRSTRGLLPAESGATDSRSLEPRMASCQLAKWQEKEFCLDDFPHSSRVSSFFCRVCGSHTHPIKTIQKSKENSGFCTFFSWKICIFSVQFGRGYPRKIAGKSWNSVLFSVRWQIMLFHTIFVGGPLAKQWRNQKPRVEFATFFCGKVACF